MRMASVMILTLWENVSSCSQLSPSVTTIADDLQQQRAGKKENKPIDIDGSIDRSTDRSGDETENVQRSCDRRWISRWILQEKKQTQTSSSWVWPIRGTIATALHGSIKFSIVQWFCFAVSISVCLYIYSTYNTQLCTVWPPVSRCQSVIWRSSLRKHGGWAPLRSFPLPLPSSGVTERVRVAVAVVAAAAVVVWSFAKDETDDIPRSLALLQCPFGPRAARCLVIKFLLLPFAPDVSSWRECLFVGRWSTHSTYVRTYVHPAVMLSSRFSFLLLLEKIDK